MDSRRSEDAAGAPGRKVEGPGGQVGPYRILAVVGEGGFGTVYLAEQAHPVRRKVALKIIKLGMDTAEVVRRFETERQALAVMDHPGIARVFDAGATDTGRPYFAMELVEGVPITRYCDEANLSTAERLALFRDVCRAVQHAHQKGVIHRDLKPSNVLVTTVDDAPAPKVIDFGIAKATGKRLGEGTLLTEAQQIIGTPEYMSPEQSQGADVDTRADVYSLGVMLYELLTGTKPFDLGTVIRVGLSEVLRQIREVEPVKPSTRVSTLGDELGTVAARRGSTPHGLRRTMRGDIDWIVLRAMEKDRERRYSSAGELADDIGRHLAHEPVAAGPPSAAYRFRKFARRNRGLLAAASLILLALLGTAGALAWGLVRVSDERDIAEGARGRERRAKEAAETAFREADDARRLEALARRAAEAALEESDAVTGFLSHMLGSVDPEQDGRDVTVREILDRAGAELGTEFADKPRIEARLRRTVGKAYSGLGLFDAAELHTPRALELARRVYEPDDRRLLDTLSDLVALRNDQGRYDESEAALVELEAAVRAQVGTEDAEYGGVLTRRGYVYTTQGRYAEAEADLTRALAILEREQGAESSVALSCLTNLSNLYWKQDRYAEAALLVERVLETRERLKGPDHPETLHARSNQAVLLEHQQRYEEAEAAYRAALDGRRRVLGEDHPDTLSSVAALGTFLRARGRFAEAVPFHERALEMRRRTLGEEHPETAEARRTLGLMLWQLGRPADAVAPLEAAVATYVRLFGAEHSTTLDARNVLGIAHYAQGHFDAALAEWEPVLEIERRTLGPDSTDALRMQANVAMAYADTGRFADAEALYLESLAALTSTLGPEARSTQDVMNNLGSLYIEMGRYEEAREINEAVLDIRRRVLGREHPLTLGTAGNLAVCLQDLGRLREAEELYVETLDALTRTLGPDHPDLGRFHQNLGLVRSGLGDPEAALDLFRRALDIYVEAGERDSPRVLDAHQNIGIVLIALGRDDEALEPLQTALEGRRRVLGPDHGATLKSLRSLSDLHLAAGRRDVARPMVEELLRRHDEVCRGPNASPEQLDDLAGLLLSCELVDLRDPDAALAFAERANEASGGMTPSVLITLAKARRATGDEPGARAAAERALARLPEGAPERTFLAGFLADDGANGDDAAPGSPASDG